MTIFYSQWTLSLTLLLPVTEIAHCFLVSISSLIIWTRIPPYQFSKAYHWSDQDYISQTLLQLGLTNLINFWPVIVESKWCLGLLNHVLQKGSSLPLCSFLISCSLENGDKEIVNFDPEMLANLGSLWPCAELPALPELATKL